ncbi:MAG: cyclic nucleotide-binding domain-containing protein [Acidimicrobiia bacterium]|nr:cyclic nucleotide-binding domain-containing protein [Acidimicrobiia bacterium]
MQLKSRDKKQSRLHRVGLFAGASSKALRNLAEAVEDVSVSAGHVLIKQGIHHHQSFVIDRGTATVDIDGRVVAELSDGDIVGELAYFAQEPATATVTAKTDLDALIIPHNRLDQVLENDPKFVRSIATELAKRLIATDALL